MHNCGTRISHLRLDFKHDIIVTYNSSKKNWSYSVQCNLLNWRIALKSIVFGFRYHVVTNV